MIDVPDLRLYTTVKSGKTWIDALGDRISSYEHSIRWQGGFWQAGFTLEDDRSVLSDFFHTMIGAHVEEIAGGKRTFEGLIYEMDLDDNKERPQLKAQICGYVFTCNWRLVSVADNTDGNVSAWINDILETDCEYILSRSIDTNTLQVRRATDIDQRAWDEILRCTLLGDGTDPYRFHVTTGRQAVYEKLVSTPLYYTRGGLVRRRSLDTMYNSVEGQYINTANKRLRLAASTTTASIAQYGQREQVLLENNIPLAAITSLRDVFLKEHSWPWARVVGSSPGGIELYAGAAPVALSPWQIQPAVIRDMGYIPKKTEPGSIFTDHRDFLIDEVNVKIRRDQDGEWEQPQLSLRTQEFTEADILEAMNDLYQERYREQQARRRK